MIGRKQTTQSILVFYAICRRFLSINKVHIYPGLIVIALILASLLSIHGSSIGVYHNFLSQDADTSQIIGSPKTIRADEWLVVTAKTISQSYNNYSSINPDIGEGENVTIFPDTPTRDWSTAFRPENILFLILPLEIAFAFKWWFFAAVMLIAAYYFSLKFLSKNIWADIALSLFLFTAPLIQWTYIGFLMLPIGYILLLILLAYKVTEDKEKRSWQHWLSMAAFAYLVVAFVLVFYPPFMIAATLVLTGFYADRVYVRARLNKKKLLDVVKAQVWLLIPIIVAGAIIFGFLTTRNGTIDAFANTVHPGYRKFSTGYFADFGRLRNLWIGGASPQINGRPSTPEFFPDNGTGNQSESAGFIWLTPLLGLFVFLGYREISNANKKYKSPPYIFLVTVMLTFIIMFVPGMVLPLIDQVAPMRWNLAVGLVTFILFGLQIDVLEKSKRKEYSPRDFRLVVISSIVFTIISLSMLISWFVSFPIDVSRRDVAYSFILIVIPIWLLVRRKPLFALWVIIGLTAVFTLTVNPLYRGLDSAIETDLVKSIRTIDTQKQGTWLFAANRTDLESVPLLAGVKSLSSHYSYPQNFWNTIDNSEKGKYVSNRAAHIQARLTPAVTNIGLSSVNTILLEINPCDTRLPPTVSPRYYIVTSSINDPDKLCLKERATVNAGNDFGKMFIYETRK